MHVLMYTRDATEQLNVLRYMYIRNQMSLYKCTYIYVVGVCILVFNYVY